MPSVLRTTCRRRLLCLLTQRRCGTSSLVEAQPRSVEQEQSILGRRRVHHPSDEQNHPGWDVTEDEQKRAVDGQHDRRAGIADE